MFDNTRGHLYELELIASKVLLPLPESMRRYVQPLLAGINQALMSNYHQNLIETDMVLIPNNDPQLLQPSAHLDGRCAAALNQITGLNHSSQFASALNKEKHLVAT
ncbi:hypothetical protein PtA15_7A192 [Puccinia triticina]|uniref:Uncharacterized protein n=1 Tax=Puccinia triticina TaxID=208348 RepID=A0ABY7CML0_9BASI|nr:uncharacterized protein PtA15_7A192 [Puccinia triticina]WAQ86466.1 hypothetical protein PtA15_7A192 [Puccinia triticina]WAR56346.1 hypothetical protein PtB15_7B194 [Puccinia triticina]